MNKKQENASSITIPAPGNHEYSIESLKMRIEDLERGQRIVKRKVYLAKRYSHFSHSCLGCYFYENELSCSELLKSFNIECHFDNKIFIEVNPEWREMETELVVRESIDEIMEIVRDNDKFKQTEKDIDKKSKVCNFGAG